MKPRTAFLYLTLMILIWGLVWPINKIGLSYTSSWNYIEWRLIFGSAMSFLIAGITGNLRLPRRKDMQMIVSVGLLQMGMMMTLSNYGLSVVGAGKATFLSFTTSIWIIPLSRLMSKRLPRLEMLSFGLGLGGTILLIEPWNWSHLEKGTAWGYLALIGSAISWAGGILCARHLTWHRPPIQLLPWQILTATLLSIGAAYANGVSLMPDTRTPVFWASFLFTGSISIAIGYWLMILISKQLAPSITSLGLLFVPIISLLISVLFLQEPLTSSLIIALALLMGGILLHIYSEKKRKENSAYEDYH